MQTGLAVTGTIFLPLQFLTGVFGMNFSTYGKDGEGYGTNGNPRYSRGLDLLNQPEPPLSATHGDAFFLFHARGMPMPR